MSPPHTKRPTNKNQPIAFDDASRRMIRAASVITISLVRDELWISHNTIINQCNYQQFHNNNLHARVPNFVDRHSALYQFIQFINFVAPVLFAGAATFQRTPTATRWFAQMGKLACSITRGMWCKIRYTPENEQKNCTNFIHARPQRSQVSDKRTPLEFDHGKKRWNFTFNEF